MVLRVKMLHLQRLLPLQAHQLLASPLSLINKRGLWVSGFGLDSCEFKRKGTNFHSQCAVEKDSEFEVDPEKAREALRKLDQQLQSLSEKPTNPPKIRELRLGFKITYSASEDPKNLFPKSLAKLK
ncbi:unnamed protein product [Ilex paraguariensis]|uniref:Uncharacterized protein n=1 Tax=Ilex paraguariensis TaxID=185542 RepID=A0ABC8UQX9_9AQUA